MLQRFIVWFLVLSSIMRVSAQSQHDADLKLFTDNIFHLSEVMLHDVASPPAAARFYAYCTVAAYEALFQSDNDLPDLKRSFSKKLEVVRPKLPKEIDPVFCANYAMLLTGKQIMPSGITLDEHLNALMTHYRDNRGFSRAKLSQNMRFAEEIVAQVVAYARADSYGKLSTYSRYRPSKEEGRWYPTPPEYMGAVEPQWQTVRPFFIDSAQQFVPRAPVSFSKDSVSEFYSLMKEVHTVSRNLTEEQRAIANYWDCNPFNVTYSGHMAVGIKKISPGGHWMGITGIACRKANVPLAKAALIHAVVACTLHDGFISCWREKYRSDRIRPETAINKYLDAEWKPLLQTPPFPEYTSGHSVISAAVSVILTHYFGDNFSFTDNSEVYFGLPERDFASFRQAAEEAAISRLYGGIHFRDACDAGMEQGRALADYIIGVKLPAVPSTPEQ